MSKYLYLFLDLASFSIPFLFSFERKWIHFIGRWKAILTGLAGMAVFFLIWDFWFTDAGVWGFNDKYITGIKAYGLPLEEILFFFLIGYSCLFIYESLHHLVRRPKWEKPAKTFFAIVALANLVIAFLNTDKLYTLTAMALNALGLILVLLFYKGFPWSKFLLGYAVSFIPFSLVNGVLTGGFTQEPVVWYNNAENLGIRMVTIPVEDSQYMMLMMLISSALYEMVLKQSAVKFPIKS